MKSYNYMNQHLDLFKENEKIICITHTSPSYKLVHPKYIHSSLNWFFVNEYMEELIKEYEPKYWIFGHTHEVIEEKIYKTKCLCNPLGIQTVKTVIYDFGKTIEI